MRRIVIEEAGATASLPPEPEPARVDLQDWLLAGAITFSELFFCAVWRAGALALAALWCLVFVVLIERSKRTEIRGKTDKPTGD